MSIVLASGAWAQGPVQQPGARAYPAFPGVTYDFSETNLNFDLTIKGGAVGNVPAKGATFRNDAAGRAADGQWEIKTQFVTVDALASPLAVDQVGVLFRAIHEEPPAGHPEVGAGLLFGSDQTFNAVGPAGAIVRFVRTAERSHGAHADAYRASFTMTHDLAAAAQLANWEFQLVGEHEPRKARRLPERWERTKTVSIVEDIFKRETVNIDVVAELEPNSITESAVFGTAFNEDNRFGPVAGAIGPANGERRSAIAGSLAEFTGMASLNQDSGSMSNQGFIAAFGEPGTAEPGSVGFSESQANIETGNFGNTVGPAGIGVAEDGVQDGDGDGGVDVVDVETELVPLTLTGTGAAIATITGSGEGATGVVAINNNAGILNNQIGSLSMAVGFAPGKATSHADLAQENSGNSDLGSADPRTALIADSFNHAQTILLVNNSSGNLGNQGTSISFSGSASVAF